MDRERHRRLMQLFEELADLPAPEQTRRLTEVRSEDVALAEAAERMLAADRGPEGGAPTIPVRGPNAAAAAAAAAARAAAEAADEPIVEVGPPPRRISHYRLEKKLGAGGMGEVHAAVDERLGRRVAIKLLPAGAEWRTESRLRMLREAQAASALNHPGIVTLFDVEVHEGRLALVMELVDGESFHVLADRGLAPAEALRLTAEAADALAAAHAAGVLHRDIKSDNLMRTRAGRVKVLDFGVAKMVGDALRGRSSKVWELASSPRVDADEREAQAQVPLETRAGVVVGTPSYMSPEQTHGAPPTPRSEVFSLGIVLYELLTGVRPFTRGNLVDTLEAVRDCRPPPPSHEAPGRTRETVAGEGKIDEAVDALVLRALAPAPEDRFADMAELAAAIRALSAAPRRGRWVVPAAGAALLVAGVAAYAVTRTAEAPGPVLLTGTARRLTFDPGCEEHPSFTPDGKTLVFVRLDDEGGERVWTVPVAGGDARPLGPPQAGVASASPVADEIVNVRSRGEAGVDLVATTLAGEGERVVATLPGGVYRSLRHSPDGKRLVMIREEQEIVEVDRGGAAPVARSLWSGGVQAASSVDYALDGKSVLAGIVVWEGDVWMVDGRF